MNTLTINKIRYQNFKGIKDFILEPNGENISVSGKNGSCKTTLADGVQYLLFGKDSQGKSDFQLKPVDEAGQEIHKLETEVEGFLEYNGNPIVLKKRFYEKWTKKRGEARKEFTGNQTDHWIDEVPIPKKEYDSKIAEIIDISAFKLVTNPNEFNNLNWTVRRQILIGMCGDVSDGDVIASDKKFKNLSSILGDCSIEDHKKKIKARKSKINKELEQIPARVSENQEVVKKSVKPDQKEKPRLEKIMKEKKEKLRVIQSNEVLSTKRIELNETTGKIQQAQNDAAKNQAGQKKPFLEAIEKLEATSRVLNGKIKDQESIILQNEKRNKVSEEAIEKVRADWHEENNKKPLKDEQPLTDDTCPTCGQALPEDQIEAAIEKFNRLKAERLADFNLKKSDQLTEITAKGKEMAGNIEQRNKDIKAAGVSIDTLQEDIDGIDIDLKAENADLDKIKDTVDTDVLDKAKAVLEQEIKALENGSSVQEETTQQEISETQTKIDVYGELDASWKAAESCRARILELEGQEETLAAEFERLESELFLIEKFIVAKVGMIEGPINSRFKLARFTLFEKQINSAISECCHVTYGGVKFNHGLNTGARIKVGVDIIDTLSEYYNFRSVIFIDNKESITSEIESESQLINLIADPSCKELTINNTKEN